MLKKLSKGEVASLLNIEKSQIRFYEQKGLLEVKKNESGYAEYGFEELDRLEMILLLKNLGMSIKEIKEVVNKASFDYAYYLKKAQKNISEEINRLKKSKREIEKRLNAYYDFANGYKIEEYEERTLYVVEGYNLPDIGIREVYELTQKYLVNYADYDYELVEYTDDEIFNGFFYFNEKPQVDAKKITIPKGSYFTYQFSFKNEKEIEAFESKALELIHEIPYKIVGPKIFIDHLYSKFYDKELWSCTIQYLVEKI